MTAKLYAVMHLLAGKMDEDFFRGTSYYPEQFGGYFPAALSLRSAPGFLTREAAEAHAKRLAEAWLLDHPGYDLDVTFNDNLCEACHDQPEAYDRVAAEFDGCVRGRVPTEPMTKRQLAALAALVAPWLYQVVAIEVGATEPEE